MNVGQVYYNSDSQWLLSVVLASMVFAVALDIKTKDFKQVLTAPKAIISGMVAQFVLLPALTLVLTLVLSLPAGVELGMILVAACPGGAISNFITHLSGGNTALSISMTAVASAAAVFLLPFNFLFWSQFNPEAIDLLRSINVDNTSLFINLLFVLALPLVMGLYLNNQFPKLANQLHRLLNITSVLALVSFILIAVIKNQSAFMSHFGLIFSVVLIHNAIALFLGFSAGKLAGLSNRDVKATTIEVGMQNSSLAIAIVFTQFGGESGMALISAFWGTWHIISGLLIAITCKKLIPTPTDKSVNI